MDESQLEKKKKKKKKKKKEGKWIRRSKEVDKKIQVNRLEEEMVLIRKYR